ncbi:hypothetical protein ASPWEDRAFT_114596 [Aspergillus wentii DTO 134E9]|uniref:Cytochrome P450 n=1 Tax=Aspergillus wentii DTO 134E9 TaxID=1073089 RepID=A0A1L9RD57_ASPWE|nr:uncharacterized protein ASPWEDRAFT_114596 [Aspergillus wentii DTO 134E9]KAI9933121.1 hypothetical protein MW887_007592 [Aspergillus wentii]OJJ32844.1 hypothetical protein ASPWEDRAFT_114596 [Aspergillus wentii DTO 134E9]
MSSPIPQPPGLPILGNIRDLDPSNVWGSLNKLAAQYRPIFKVKILGNQLVFVTSAKLLEEICDETRFQKCVKGPIVEVRQLVHDSLFTAYAHEESWGIAHRIMHPLVTPQAVERECGGMQETVVELIKKWTGGDGTKQRVNVSNDLDRLNHAANMLCFFNQRVDCINGAEPAVIKAMSDTTFESVRRPNRLRLVNWLFYNRSFDKNIRICRDYCADVIAHRRANPTDKKDMLHALLHGKDPETGESLPDSRVIDEIINIFIGSATAPNLLTFAIYYLAKNPQEITRAREELDSVVGGPTTPIEYSHLSQLPYCEAILRESFRLSATAPGFNIEPLPSTEGPVLLGGGEYEIPAKQAMIAILSAVNRDPEVFEDPEAFKPERMVGEKFDALPKGVKKGFGNGKRECFGKQYAWDWSFHTLATLIKDVDFELADKNYTFSMEGDNYNGAFSTKPLNMFAVTKRREVAA